MITALSIVVFVLAVGLVWTWATHPSKSDLSSLVDRVRELEYNMGDAEASIQRLRAQVSPPAKPKAAKRRAKK